MATLSNVVTACLPATPAMPTFVTKYPPPSGAYKGNVVTALSGGSGGSGTTSSTPKYYWS